MSYDCRAQGEQAHHLAQTHQLQRFLNFRTTVTGWAENFWQIEAKEPREKVP
jgi:hypothetical protein